VSGFHQKVLANFVPGHWIDDALWAEVDPELFYPDQGGSPEPARIICRKCPVIAQCLQYAIANNIQYGVWGGMSERKRREFAAGRASS